MASKIEVHVTRVRFRRLSATAWAAFWLSIFVGFPAASGMAFFDAIGVTSWAKYCAGLAMGSFYIGLGSICLGLSILIARDVRRG